MTGNRDPYAQRLEAVLARIRGAERDASRPPGGVDLLAVSKGHEAGAIRSLAALGHRRFGESYFQEAVEKLDVLADLDLEWHFIGPVQSNKTRGLAERFDWVQSVDRAKILRRLDEQRPADMTPLNICLQVNISGEAQKSGADPASLPELAEAAAGYGHLRLRGLMTIPAASDDPAELRRAFARTRTLFEDLKARGHELDTLSMGMSGDLEAAVAEGSTMVRVGTALFGSRKVRD